ncbi:hypothetical protein [Methanoregula sp.]|uniref:hypothetical protein n=1 Tax=Methanoregula sp. TaxID=2052170 RepID=UPI0023752ACD|nr:hypothetical protein [Methanoregula sp.]MDD1687456.1 hypothetical protein [Methanoregula sp.]
MTGYIDRIMGILEPKVGHALAQSALRIKCKKLGITPDGITAETLPLLADDLFEPLSIFAGDEFARSLTMQIKELSSEERDKTAQAVVS